MKFINYKTLMITLIIICFISTVIPGLGLIAGILALILSYQIKTNIDLQNTKYDIENEIKDKEEEFNLLKDEIKYKLSEIDKFNKHIYKLKNEKYKEYKQLEDLKNKLNLMSELHNYKELEKDLYVFNVGMFDKKYEYKLSEEYNEQLKINRTKQKNMVKEDKAISKFNTDYVFSKDLKSSEKKKYIDSICKLITRAFNNECDLIINKLTVANIINSRKKLEYAKEQINKIAGIYNVSISFDYHKLKIEELQLKYEYAIKVQEEKEEQREIKEKIREEARVQAEINNLEKEAEKEERMYEKLLEKVKSDLEKATEKEKNMLQEKIQSLEENLKFAKEKMKRAESMAQKTKSGYVYVISNIGSFGEDIYKIGMTRRLDPMERVNELGSASVPFAFDVHAMIYSEDAPALEKELHNSFSEKRLNKVNLRKEFFNIKLSEIEDVVKNKLGTNIEFTKTAEAIQYRQSKLM